MFQGASALTLDAKGRITVPARHRDALQACADGKLTITKHPHGYLLVFPRPQWDIFQAKVMELPESSASWRRVFLGNAVDVEVDASSRVLVSPELRAGAGLTRDVMLLGVGHWLELWDKSAHERHEQAVAAAEMPPEIKEFRL